MEIETFGNLSNATPETRRAGLTQEDFLKVLLTQLTFQDPLEPMDNGEFMAQFAQLTSLQQTRELTDKVDTLLSLQSGAQAVALVGRSVEVKTDTSTAVGSVSAVNFRNGNPEISITTSDGVPLTGITIGQIVTVR
jgi:flagellar basal-body rod modification protein FlgD